MAPPAKAAARLDPLAQRPRSLFACPLRRRAWRRRRARRSRRAALAGSALALGTGLWACGVLGLSHLSLPYALSYHPGLVFAGWLAGLVFMLLGLALAGRPGRPIDTLAGAVVLALGVSLCEMGLLLGLGALPGIAWAWWGGAPRGM